MLLRLELERVRTIDAVRDFVAGSEPADSHFIDRAEACDFVTRTLRRLGRYPDSVVGSRPSSHQHRGER